MPDDSSILKSLLALGVNQTGAVRSAATQAGAIAWDKVWGRIKEVAKAMRIPTLPDLPPEFASWSREQQNEFARQKMEDPVWRDAMEKQLSGYGGMSAGLKPVSPWYSPFANALEAKLAKRAAGLPERTYTDPKTGNLVTVPAKPPESVHPPNVVQQAIHESAKETKVDADVLREFGWDKVGQKGGMTKEEAVGSVREGVPELRDVVLGEDWSSFRRRMNEKYGEGFSYSELSPEDRIGFDRAESQIESGGVKYSSYVEPGSDPSTYRELFVTAPNPEPVREIRRKSGSVRDADVLTMDDLDTFDKFTAEGKTTQWRDGHGDYADIENPIVRLRYNIRTDSAGRRGLFLEEFQPPQKGEFEKMPEWAQKHWLDIGLKRAMKEAADQGLEWVGWTTGEMQVARYPGIQTVADKLLLRKDPHTERGYKLIAFKNGLDTKSLYVKDVAELESYIGKEPARRLLSKIDEGKNADPYFNEYNGVTIEGDELKIGGHGLKRLYDESAPQRMSEAARRLGGGKVGTVEVPMTGELGRYRVVGGGLNRTAVGYEQARRLAEAHPGAQITELKPEGVQNIPVPAIDLTPAVSSHLTTRGAPLFSLAPLAPVTTLSLGPPSQRKQEKR